MKPDDALFDLLGLEISHDVLSISTPGSQIYLGNEKLSVGLARLLNEVSLPRYPIFSPRKADNT